MPRVTLPDYVRRAQKRARDKDSRLRAKVMAGGGTRAEAFASVADVSPRLAADVVASMSPRQQRAYVKRLEQYTSRSTSFETLLDHSLISKASVRRMEAMRQTYNRMAEARERRIDRLTRGTSIRERFGTVEEARQAVQGNLTLNGQRIGGTLSMGRTAKLEKMEPPRSPGAAQRREKMLRDMTRAGADDDRRRLVRRTVQQMLLLQGDVRTANRIRNLSNDQFDVLTTVTDFMNLLTTKFDSGDYTDDLLRMTNGELRENLSTQATAHGDNQQLNDLIDLVRAEIG